MSREPIISVSGLRGIIGQTLDPIVAANYVAAFSAEIDEGPVIVSRDGRSTGCMIADAVKSALCACGRDVLYADVAATPTTGILVRSCGAVGGIQISASHNPLDYNGIKLFGAEGRIIGEASGQHVLDRYRSGGVNWCGFANVGHVSSVPDTTGKHLRAILDTVDVERIRHSKFNVLLDANHGAGSVLGVPLLEELGCRVTLLGGEADGRFDHPPEPTAANLMEVGRHVVAAKVDVGFCQDPDADRLALLDDKGLYIGEEYTVSIVVGNILSEARGPIVTNCSTSRMTEDLCMKYGVPFFRSKVGEANVCDVMIEQQAIFGGEGNGGPIDPRVGYVRDSFVGMAQVLEAMSKSNKTISQLAGEIPKYEIHKSKVGIQADKIENSFDRLEAHYSDARPNRMDGLRLDWSDQWLLVRASNTEPIVRLVAESNSEENAKQLCAEATSILSG